MIELIGVLAVIAVLAGMMIPSAIRILDQIASEREVALLGNLGNAFQKAIVRAHSIGPLADWPSLVATEAGLPTTEVTANPRRNPRVVLFDKSETGWLYNLTFPWYQTNGSPPGLSAPPANARVILVSSLGRPLPTTLNQSSISAAQFTDLWNAPDHSLPASAPWNTWNGDAYDVKVQRVDLSSLFVKVVLSTYLSTNAGLYRIDNSALHSAPTGAGVTRYFMKGSVLQLHSAAPDMALQHSEVLESDTSFVYENGIWRSSIVGGVPAVLADASGIVEAFLRAPENIRAVNTNGMAIQQIMVVSNFVSYMSNYNVWAEGNFANTTLQSHLEQVQAHMMDSVWGLFLNPYKSSYSTNTATYHTPTNNYAPCEL